MDDQLYIRIRGRVQGPFDKEKLQSLVRRGQLSRMHQLSEDGTNWQRADEFPELFVVQKSKASSEDLGYQGNKEEPGVTEQGYPEQETQTTGSGGQQWYYAVGGKKFGPIDIETLRHLVGAGQLKSSSQVWCQGMHNWATIESIAGLIPPSEKDDFFTTVESEFETGNDTNANKPQKEDLFDREAISSLGDAQGWLLFIAWSGFVIAAIILALGLISLVFGISEKSSGIAISGLIWILHGSVILIGALYLSSYQKHISHFLKYNKRQALNMALRRLCHFWNYIGILLIISYALVAIFFLLLALGAGMTGAMLRETF